MQHCDRQQTCYNRYIEQYFQHMGQTILTDVDDTDARVDDLDFWNDWLKHRANFLSDPSFTVIEQTDKTYTIAAIYTVDTGRHIQSIFIVVTPRGIHEWYVDYSRVTERDRAMPVYLGRVPSHREYYHITTLTAPFLTEDEIDNL